MTARAALAAALALALTGAGCGKKGGLEPPPEAELYKQTYPAPESEDTPAAGDAREDSR